MPANSGWTYLSPHFDDVALSCGGLVWEQAQVGRVEILTICAGTPGSGPISAFAAALHARWEPQPEQGMTADTADEIVRVRRQEDKAACRILGARQRLLEVPDCIYRSAPGEPDHPLYATEMALFGPLHPLEIDLVTQLADKLALVIPDQAAIVCPLALGSHVDHQLVRRAAELTGRQLWYYADYPYVRIPGIHLPQASWHSQIFQVSGAGLYAWGEAVAAYKTQISTFWQDAQAMRSDLREYGAQGVQLWRKLPGIN